MYVIIYSTYKISKNTIKWKYTNDMTIDQVLWCIKAICTASNFKFLNINRYSILISISIYV